MKKKKLIKEKRDKKDIDKKNIMSILLKIWLILLLIGNIFTASSYIVFNSYLTKRFPHVPANIFYLFGLFALVYIISVIALLKSRKWGFYSFFIVALIIFIINLVRGLNTIITLLGLIPLIILYLLLRPKWKNLK